MCHRNVWCLLLVKTVSFVYISGYTFCPSGFIQIGASCYNYNPAGNNFAEHMSICTSMGGYLTIINSTQESQALGDYLLG